MDTPQFLFYATVYYADGRRRTPSSYVFEKLAEGVSMLRQNFEDRENEIDSIEVKELEFIETKVLPDEASILIPHTDDALADEVDEESREMRIEDAEDGDPSESIVVIFPEEQEADDLLCRAFYMGPFMKAESPEALIEKLIEDPFIAAAPIDYVWLYRPTGQSKQVKM